MLVGIGNNDRGSARLASEFGRTVLVQDGPIFHHEIWEKGERTFNGPEIKIKGQRLLSELTFGLPGIIRNIRSYRQLMENPKVLRVLGDGTARKSYLAVEDCVAVIMAAFAHGPPGTDAEGFTEIYNLGTNEYCRVNDSIGWICGALGLQPELQYTGGDRGWVGDNPFIFLDTKKICSTGWKPKFTIRQGVESTVAWLKNNHWIFSKR